MVAQTDERRERLRKELVSCLRSFVITKEIHLTTEYTNEIADDVLLNRPIDVMFPELVLRANRGHESQNMQQTLPCQSEQ